MGVEGVESHLGSALGVGHGSATTKQVSFINYRTSTPHFSRQAACLLLPAHGFGADDESSCALLHLAEFGPLKTSESHKAFGSGYR
jgi:hypothetical protein